MRIAIPHSLPREEVKSRFDARMHEIAEHVPGGAEVHTSWPDDYLMDLVVTAMGQQLHGHLDIKESEVVIVIDLPPALSFVEGLIGPAIEKKGQKLLAAG